MAKVNVTWDDSGFQKIIASLSGRLENFEKRTLMGMADALLTLAREEVPFREGHLSRSGSAYWNPMEDCAETAFDTDYASYVHEGVRKDGTHVIQHYGNGRKKKYLEDPLKMNITKWTEIAESGLEEFIAGA